MKTSPHPDHCGPGYRYPTRARDLAFQLWAFKCSRRLSAWLRSWQLWASSEGWECIPGERTLRHWATKGDWPAATARALRTIAPDVAGELVSDLLMGAAEGMAYLRDVLAGRVTHPNSTRIRAILTALSMIGVPDLAHATVRDVMAERETERGRPLNVTGQVPAEPESWRR